MAGPRSFWDVFEGAVARFPNHVAVEVLRKSGLERVTYRELRDMAEAIARWLSAEGVRTGDRCSILADNDARWCAFYLGAFRIGATVVPLDTNYSAAQVATVLGASGARLLVSGLRLMPVAEEALRSGGARLIRMEGPGDGRSLDDVLATARDATPLPPCPLELSHTAVILYTSGTTADPKGVMLSHGNLLAERDSAFAVVNVTERDAVLGVLPLFHSLAQVGNLLLPFAVGARVVYLETLNTSDLLQALAERQITIFVCVPQFFYLIHQRVTSEVKKGGWVRERLYRSLLATSLALRGVGINIGPKVFAKVHAVLGQHMRLLVTGGSKFDPAVGRDLYGLGFTILQAYGLTETTGAATINRPNEAHIDTVGRILPGNELRVLPPEGDADDGEVAIRGPIVMQGYYNRPDATAAVMREGGWFLTGDLGRLDGEGRLTITGRKKEMIVLASGKNIYPEEVEAHYRKSSIIKELCVMGVSRPDEPTTERLHAVIVLDQDALRAKKIANAGEQLRWEMEGLSADLPSHKRVLGYDVWFEPLPRTTTGKLRRFAIQKEMAARTASRQAEVAQPLSDADQEWLEGKHVGEAMGLVARRAKAGVTARPDANLELDLGLDSMERVELLTELEQRFRVKVPEAAVHEIFTVRQLVDAVRPVGDTQGGASVDEAWPAIFASLPSESDPVLGRLLARRPLAERFLFIASRILGRSLARIEVTGLEHLPATGPFLICPNHQGYLDPFLLCSVLPYRTFAPLFSVGAAEYFRSPFMSWAARQLNVVPVDAEASLVPAMKAGAFGLTHGRILLLFPEGERSIDGTVKRFKKGAPILAKHVGVPVVPVALKGIYELWPRGRTFNWSLVWPWSGHRVRIAIGPPLAVGADERDADAALRLRAAVDQMWQRL